MQKFLDYSLEQRALGCVLVNPEAWNSVMMDWDYTAFSDPDHRDIAKVVQELGAKGETPSATRIYRKMRKNSDSRNILDHLIAATNSVITSSEAERLVHLLNDMAAKRRVYEQLGRAMDEISSADDDTPVEDILAKAQNALVGAFIKEGQSEIKSWQDVLNEVHDHFLKVQEGKGAIKFHTSLRGLNDLLGGFELGELSIIAGRPSMGKSALAVNVAVDFCKQGLHTAVFTLEQSSLQMAHRILAAQGNIPLSLFKSKMEATYEDKFNSVLTNTAGLPLSVIDIRRPTVDRVKMLAQVCKAQNPDLKFIVIDYFQEISLELGRFNEATAIRNALSELRALASILDVHLILVSQLNREVDKRDNKRPIKSDLRGSGGFEEVADKIIFLYRNGYYQPGFMGNDAGDNITELINAKNRQGGNDGHMTLAMFDRDYMRFSDLTGDPKYHYLEWLKAQ